MTETQRSWLYTAITLAVLGVIVGIGALVVNKPWVRQETGYEILLKWYGTEPYDAICRKPPERFIAKHITRADAELYQYLHCP
jgi:hypothetical protein